MVTDTAARSENQRFYVPQLDGLRFFAFLAVFLFHIPQIAFVPRTALRWDSLEWWTRSTILAGAFGVDLFFVLSSFLITLLLVREADARGRINVPAFWMRRILRIWPLYYAYVALCAVLEALPVRPVAAFALFVGNWPLAGPVSDRSLIGVLWSVQVEEQFYFAWPLLLAVLPRRSLRLMCLGMISVSLVYRGVILANGGGLEQIWPNTLARLDPIAIGALIALTWRDPRGAFGPTLRAVVGVGAPLVMVATAGLLSHELLQLGAERTIPLLIRPGVFHFAATILVFLVVAVCCGGLVLSALAARGSWLGHSMFVYLGRISYGLYVFHLASIRVVELLWWPWRGVLGFAIAVLLAALSYRFFEQPFLRLKERFTYISSAPSEPAVRRSA